MKRLLLSTAVMLFLGANVMAQVDVTPANWKFSAMPKGGVKSIFIVEAARIGGNMSYAGEGGDPGTKGFRRADALPGAIAVNDWAEPDASYPDMTPDEKARFENFYDAMQIVDGGELGNILCYQGISSTAVDARATKNKSAMGGPALNMFTQKNLVPGIYRFSLSIRVIMNAGAPAAKMNLYCASSWYDQLNYAGSNTGILFDIDCVPDFNDFWTTYQYEVEVTKNADANYDLTPINNKLGVGGFANDAVILLRDYKIEKIADATLDGKVKITAENWDDAPTGISNTLSNNIIVFGNANGITVIDAKTLIEVYSTNGQLIAQKQPNVDSFTTIPVSQKGVYIVKVGKISKKVNL